MPQRWAVICGLIRDEAALVSKLETLERWRQDGIIENVVLSTWSGELQRHPVAKEFFAGKPYILVESEPPILKAPGHVMHQMKALYYGLQAVPKHTLILRLRPDLGVLSESICEAILDPGIELQQENFWPEVFSNKIMINSAFIDQPYYWNDIIFFGKREDLLLLTNFNLSTEYLCINTAPEQFFFRSPFAKHFPLLESFLQVMPHYAYGDSIVADSRMKALLASDLFLDVAALHLSLLKKYLRVGFVASSKRRVGVERSFQIRDVFAAANDIKGIEYHHGAQAANLVDENAIDNILSETYEQDDLGNRFSAALRRVRATSPEKYCEANPLKPNSQLRELANSINAAMPGMPNRIDSLSDVKGKHFYVGGHRDRLSLIEGSSETRRLEEEINFLRRHIDQLNSKYRL